MVPEHHMGLNLLNSWTLSFFRKWWRSMSLASIVRYRDYCVREAQGRWNPAEKLRLRMKSPIRGVIFLREVPSDLFTFGDVFEQDVYGVVLRHLPECSTIIDLGANIGLASLYLANAYPSARIFAVEPNRGNFELLKANLKDLIREGRCVPLQAAVWSVRRALTVDPRWLPDAYNGYRLLERPPYQDVADQVQGFTMEDILASSEFQQVDLLKVDIEGAEIELFRNDLSWLGRVRAIAIEFHGRSRDECGFDQILTAQRFKVCEEDSHTVLAVRSDLPTTGKADSHRA
jgi:FkbM family methyltransferase